MAELTIRCEQLSDYRAVEELTYEAFWNHHVPGCDEHLLMHALRESIDYIPALSFVAHDGDLLVGYICYTKAMIQSADGINHPALCMGPISVLPSHQKTGIGGKMIRHSLEAAKALGHTIVCLYGDPRYYSRFGFRCAERYDIQTADGFWAVALMAKPLVDGAFSGVSGRFIESPDYEVEAEAMAEYAKTFTSKEKGASDFQKDFSVLVTLRYQ